MILVDTSIWIDHFRNNDQKLASLLEAQQVLVHPFVIGELALGTIKNRHLILPMLDNLPQAVTADDNEVRGVIERHRLFGLGIGFVDAHLLAAARLSSAKLWTHDKRLQQAAQSFNLAI